LEGSKLVGDITDIQEYSPSPFFGSLIEQVRNLGQALFLVGVADFVCLVG
jgi:hypothetical protein